MRGRRGAASVAANPVLIGAATLLVTIVAVFLAYNANAGLPFVPTYQLTAEVPNANQLVQGNDVRIGGTRVGTVSKIAPKTLPSGKVIALLTLKLQTKVKPLTKSTTVLIRPRSALGLKYVELTPGKRSDPAYADGATIPVKYATPAPVDIDEVFNTFDAKTRRASQKNLVALGDTLAGRGGDLNLAIHDLGPLLASLEPVARNLADARTRLGPFIQSLAAFTGEIAPVAERQAALFRNLDTTFLALADVKGFIQETIAKGPATLDTAIHAFRVQRPFLAHSAALFADLRPGARALGQTAPTLSDALTTGTRVLPKTVALSNRTAAALTTLRNFSTDPLVKLGIGDLTRTAKLASPTVAYLTPAQTTCNYVSLWFRNVSNLLSDGDVNGTWQRFIIIITPSGPNNEGSPSSRPANGPSKDNHLHVDPYPHTASPGQPHECEAGNEPYLSGVTQRSNPAGTQPATTERTVVDRSTSGG
jgi:phospholipid/cholesterol/gamma-HCH transport system substrate-binding protein